MSFLLYSFSIQFRIHLLFGILIRKVNFILLAIGNSFRYTLCVATSTIKPLCNSYYVSVARRQILYEDITINNNNMAGTRHFQFGSIHSQSSFKKCNSRFQVHAMWKCLRCTLSGILWHYLEYLKRKFQSMFVPLLSSRHQLFS